MKLNQLVVLASILGSVIAVYPPVEVDYSGVENPDELVTIQGSLNELGDKVVLDEEDEKDTLLGSSANSVKSHSLASSSSLSGGLADKKPATQGEHSSESRFEAFYMALSMIFVSEIGDKTFLLAALMAMRHNHLVVFSAAGSALVLMTVLSGLLGYILPNLLSPTITRFAAAALFLVFGVNLLREGLAMDKNAGVEEEMAEAEEEIAANEINQRSTSIEHGGMPAQTGTYDYYLQLVKSYTESVLSPAWVATFVMIFLGEWGDRSQIATIAMAAGNYTMVILGGSIGHLICTAGAVWGGQMLAKRISMRTVILGGAAAFLLFAVLYLLQAVYGDE